MAADENILLVEFESETDLDVEFDFYFPDETGEKVAKEKAVDVWEAGESENVQNGMFVGLVTGRLLQVKKTGGGYCKWIPAIFRSC